MPLTEVTLELLDGSDDQTARIVTMKDDETISVQRSSEDVSKDLPSFHDNLNINNGAVSRLHATFVCKPKQTSDFDPASPLQHSIYVIDEKSRHGTYVNDERLKTDVEHELFAGDIIKFGINIDRPQEREYHGHYLYKDGDIDRFPASFKAAEYLISFKDISDPISRSRGISYSVPDDIDSIADSDVDSALYVAETVFNQQSDVIDLTQHEVEDIVEQVMDQKRDIFNDEVHLDDSIDDDYLDEENIDDSLSENSDVFSEADPFSEVDPFAVPEVHTLTTLGPMSGDVAVVTAEELIEAQTQSATDLLTASLIAAGAQDGEVAAVSVIADPEDSFKQTNRKRKFDDIIDDPDSDGDEEDEYDQPIIGADERRRLEQSMRHVPNRSCLVSSADRSRPIKRSRLGMAALGIGMFLAGSTTTFAALAYLPDIA